MDLKQPLVSVGLPIYNRPEGLRKTLESFVNQTYKNIEIIIADNCSPNPEVAQIANEFLQRDSRISYYRHSENKGWGFNTNFVIEKARGDYFMRATDDDWWDISFIEKVMEKMLATPTALIGVSNFENVDEAGNFVQTYGLKDRMPYLKEFERKDFQKLKNYINQFEGFGKATLYLGIYKKEVLISECVHELLRTENLEGDLLINLYCLLRGDVVVCPEVMIKFMVGNQKNYELHVLEDKVVNLYFLKFNYKKFKSLKNKWLKYFISQISIIKQSPLSYFDKRRLVLLVNKRILLFYYDLICVCFSLKYFNVFNKLKRKFTLE